MRQLLVGQYRLNTRHISNDLRETRPCPLRDSSVMLLVLLSSGRSETWSLMDVNCCKGIVWWNHNQANKHNKAKTTCGRYFPLYKDCLAEPRPPPPTSCVPDPQSFLRKSSKCYLLTHCFKLQPGAGALSPNSRLAMSPPTAESSLSSTRDLPTLSDLHLASPRSSVSSSSRPDVILRRSLLC